MPSDQNKMTANKLRGFASLPVGWTFGNAQPPSALVIGLAIKVEQMLRDAGYPETDAFPGDADTIAVTGYLDGCSVNIEVCDEGRYKESATNG